MSDIVIKAENLGKKYTIGHQSENGRYLALRDVLMQNAQTLWNKTKDLVQGKPIIQGDTLEEVWALNDVSFEIRRGETVGIIGRNGAGKSTLLKVLSRITEPSAGRVTIKGRVASLLEVGTGFHPELTGRENIYLNGAILGMHRAEIKHKFDEIASFAEVERFLDTPVKRYSSGMYVRLAFAVAAHLQPEILMVDEVLAVGDIAFQKKCVGKMQDVAGQGRTVLLVSHNMSTVKYLCNRAMLLEHGSLKMAGSVDRVVAGYLSVNSPDRAEKIVAENDHLTGINKMRINRIRLLDPLFGGFSVFWRQPISVAFELDVFAKVEDVSFGAGIRTQDGLAVLTVHHDDEGAPQWVFEPGRFEIQFTLHNELRPGLYKLGIGAHEQYIARNLCYLPDVVDLEVLDFAGDGYLPIQYNAGIVNGSSTWRHPRKTSGTIS
jgi:ABC-type polysaccharide/polyol phosphate transport system ATPase subunit